MLLLLGAALSIQAQAPAWWTRTLSGQPLSARFVQESDSAVFGKVRKEGRLQLAPGGKLRVAYDGGLLLLSDGKKVIQYDPDTRSAQRMELKRAVREAPLLALLADPAALDRHFAITFKGEAVHLAPRTKDLPAVDAEGKGAFPTRFRWTDPTGAAQELRILQATRTAAPASAFRFQAPSGTRWQE